MQVLCDNLSPVGRPIAPSPVLAAGLACILIWALVVPLLYLALILNAYPLVGHGSLTMRPRLEFLTRGFSQPYAGFELVVVCQKIILTGALAAFNPGSLEQLQAALMASIIFLFLHVFLSPYRTLGDSRLAAVASSALVLVFLGSLMVQMQNLMPELFTAEHGYQTHLVTLLLLAVGLVGLYGVILGLLLVTGLAWQQERDAPLAELRRWDNKLSPELPQLRDAPSGKRFHGFLSHKWSTRRTRTPSD